MTKYNEPLTVSLQGDFGELGDVGTKGRAGDKVRNVFNPSE